MNDRANGNGNGWKVPAWFIGITGATITLVILVFGVFKDRQDLIDRVTNNANNIAINAGRQAQLREDMTRELKSINFRLCRMEAQKAIPLYETCSDFSRTLPTTGPIIQ